jgi:hypothetical protein
MPAAVTLTGKAGPALSLTAKTFTDVQSMGLDFDGNMITLNQPGAVVGPIDIGPATTVTATKSGNTWTLVIS